MPIVIVPTSHDLFDPTSPGPIGLITPAAGTFGTLIDTLGHSDLITQITPGAAGAGFQLINAGSLNRQIYKCTLTFAGLSASAKTADFTIATLPAKTKLCSIIADTTIPYTGGGETAATLIVGVTAGGNTLIVSHDVFSAVVTKGLLDADLGTALTRATAIQGGYLPSWSGTTIISVRLTTTTNNTSGLTAGSTTYYLVCERFL